MGSLTPRCQNSDDASVSNNCSIYGIVQDVSRRPRPDRLAVARVTGIAKRYVNSELELSRTNAGALFWLSVAAFWPHSTMSRCDTSTNDAQRLRSSARVRVPIREPRDLLLIRRFRSRYFGTEVISGWLQFWLQFADVCPSPPTSTEAGFHRVRTQPDTVGHGEANS